MREYQSKRLLKKCIVVALCLGLQGPLPALGHSKQTPPPVEVPELELPGGRKLLYERSFASEEEVRVKRSFWIKLVDMVAGARESHNLVRPYSVATDSRGRIIVTDPGIPAIHIFDFAKQKYKFIHRDGKNAFQAPQCVAVDAQDNFYVTDSEAGKIFVFDAEGNFRRAIGSLKKGEGFFKRPTGIAVDSQSQRIYVSDTWRQQIFVLDMQGSVLHVIGKNGVAPGEFNFPTELKLVEHDLYVVDAMNFRIQRFDTAGEAYVLVGSPDGADLDLFRPKGIGIDSEHNLYVVDGLDDLVRVFNPAGHLLYSFGGSGSQAGEFQLPAGLFISGDDHIHVVDSYNRRVQVFHYVSSGLRTGKLKP